MSALLRHLARTRRAAAAGEFALLLPLFLILLLGTIDVGRFLWDLNQAEKATQVGARMAVVTTSVSPGLVAADFVSSDTPSGELIPASALEELTCTAEACSCTGACPVGDLTVDSDAFTALVTRMAQIMPGITEDNVEVRYRGSGFGFAGNPSAVGGMQISPLVTVSLVDVQFQPITAYLLTSFTLPAASTTLSAEDMSGSYSN